MENSVEAIEEAIVQLSPEKLEKLRSWFEKFDENAWDKQIERDTVNGKLDALAQAAIAEHSVGRSKKL